MTKPREKDEGRVKPLRETVARAMIDPLPEPMKGADWLTEREMEQYYRWADRILAALGLEPSGEYLLVKREDLQQALALDVHASASPRVARLRAALHPEEEETNG